jgi:hypothetical protein
VNPVKEVGRIAREYEIPYTINVFFPAFRPVSQQPKSYCLNGTIVPFPCICTKPAIYTRVTVRGVVNISY